MHKVTSGSDSFIGNVYKLFKEQIILVLYKMFLRIKNEGMFSTSLNYANITYIKTIQGQNEKRKFEANLVIVMNSDAQILNLRRYIF